MSRWLSSLLLCAAILAPACNAGILGEACNEDPCPDSCKTDADCDQSRYCDAGRCRLGCGPENPCPSGEYCGARGRCQLIDPATEGTCPNIQVKVTPIVPIILLLIDQSGSMTAPFGTILGKSVSRWEAVRYALGDPKEGAVTKLQTKVRFAATLYHSKAGFRGGQCPILTRSAGTPAGVPRLGNRDAIVDLLANNVPVQDTPTAEAVEAVTNDLIAFAADIDKTAPKILLLATDGDPDTCADPDAHDEVSQAISEKSVQSAHALGVKTYVLSVGADVTQSHLERLANAGMGFPLAPKRAPYFQGNNPTELADAFNTITRGARSCSFNLNGEVKKPSAGTVWLNETPLKFGVDWDLQDPRTLILLGAACEEFKLADDVRLRAEFPCGTVLM